MRNLTLAALALVGLLSACGSGIVKPGGGALVAKATTPGGTYSFNCDPAAQAGAQIVISDDMTFSCPSTDAKATLTVVLRTVTTNDGKDTTSLLNTVLLIPGPPLTTYAGAGSMSSYTRLGNSNLNGSFSSTPASGVKIDGEFNFNGE